MQNEMTGFRRFGVISDEKYNLYRSPRAPWEWLPTCSSRVAPGGRRRNFHLFYFIVFAMFFTLKSQGG